MAKTSTPTKADVFVSDLLDVLKKHGLKLVQSDDYDCDENHVGMSYSFEGKEVYVSIGDVLDAQKKR